MVHASARQFAPHRTLGVLPIDARRRKGMLTGGEFQDISRQFVEEERPEMNMPTIILVGRIDKPPLELVLPEIDDPLGILANDLRCSDPRRFLPFSTDARNSGSSTS
jgi:hypothetical protein